ncbi:MAG: glycosyltransferase [Pseudomonadota bacterium]
MSVFGYIRFSYFGRSDARLARQTADDETRFRALYADRRMEERFYFFENLTLPSLRAQTDPDFRVLVLASNVMPDRYKTRLATAIADIPQVDVLYSDAAHVTDAINPAMGDMTAGIKENTVHFRLDDDDAICSDMVARLRARAPHAQPDELITYPNGFYLTHWDGAPHLVRKFEPYIAIGFAFVNRPGQIRNPYQCKHGSHYRLVPTSMDPRPYAYIHCAHPSSDTRDAQDRKFRNALKHDVHYGSERARNRIASTVQRRFPGFTLEGLEALISNAPGVAGHMPAHAGRSLEEGVAALPR